MKTYDRTVSGLSLLEVTIALVMFASIVTLILSVVYSSRKYAKFHGLDFLPETALAMNIALQEYGKVSLTHPSYTSSSGTYEEIGRGISLPSGWKVARGRADLDGDGVVGPDDPVFLYLEPQQ